MVKKYYFIFYLILIFSLLFIVGENKCSAVFNSYEIAIENNMECDEANQKVLDNFCWCVGNDVFEFNTQLVNVTTKDGYIWKFHNETSDKYYTISPDNFQLYIIDGTSKSMTQCALEKYLLFGDKLSDRLNEFVESGGAYIGRCAGSFTPISFNKDKRFSNPPPNNKLTVMEHILVDLNAWLDNGAPDVDTYFYRGFPFFDQFFIMKNNRVLPFVPRGISNTAAPWTVGAEAYREYYHKDPGEWKESGLCIDLVELDKNHPILKDYWGDSIYTWVQLGVFSNIPDGVSVLARYSNGWEDNSKYDVNQWEYIPESGDFFKSRFRLSLLSWLGNFEKWRNEMVKENWRGEEVGFAHWYNDSRWHKLEDTKIPTGMSNNPAIIAFDYEDGRMLLEGPHVLTDIGWDEDFYIENRPYNYQENEGEPKSFGKDAEWHGFYKVIRENDKDIRLFWYALRETAWAVGVDDDSLPPAHGKSQVVDLNPPFQDSTTINLECCVARPANESDFWDFNGSKDAHKLYLHYKFYEKDNQNWSPWIAINPNNPITQKPYTFEFDVDSMGNGTGKYRFYSNLSTLINGTWIDETSPNDLDENVYDAEVEVGGEISSEIAVENTYIYAMSTVNFNGSRSLTKNGTTITNYTWDFGDGNQSYVSNPIHTYYDDGEYNVSLTVTNNESNSSSSNTTIKVHNNAPTAEFTVDYDVVFVNEKVNFTDNSSDIDGNVTLWSWSLGDETNSSMQSINHTYSNSGLYEVSLGITDDDSETRSMIANVLVIDKLVNQSKTPTNIIWNNIQDAVDNSSNGEYIYIENGTYQENITINKTISLIGEDKDCVLIQGSLSLFNPHDYELPNNRTIDYDNMIVVEMYGNQLLMHFNNDSNVGENYSSSNLVYDYSSENHNGVKNNLIWNTSTIKGMGAFDFNGDNSTINLTYFPCLGSDNVTISAWVYYQGNNDSYSPILSQCNTTHGFCLYVNNSDCKPVFQLDNDKAVSSINITTNSWHYVVGVYDNTSLKIYVDGEITGYTNKSGSGVIRDCYIGFDNISNYYCGTIDEVAVWNRSLSDYEIRAIYYSNTGVNVQGLSFNDSDVGLICVCEHSYISDCRFTNNSVGILFDNASVCTIEMCNITNSDVGVRIKNSNPDDFYPNFISNCVIDNITSGILVNNTSHLYVYHTLVNGSSVNMSFTDCDFDNITVLYTTSPKNVAPEELNVTAPSMGEINITYNFSAYTFDKNDDQMLYMFDWGDGNDTGWLWLYENNETVNASYTWLEDGNYQVTVEVKDVFNAEINKTSVFIIDVLPPLINSVDSNPNPLGYGCNISITANVFDNKTGGNSGVKTVKVNITSPNDICLGNFTMNLSGNDTYELVFNNTWERGRYNYSIWACDNANYTIFSEGYYFNVSAYANITVCTVKDEYTDNETVNLTDPPGSSYKVGYELLDNNKVLHIWNPYDSYYFNTSNGVQFTNHKDEYWSTNVLMLGYYNNDSWNLIYRTDNLSGFNKNIISDNETYVNATLWKDLTYQGYDFRLAVRYYLGFDDNELTVIPYIKNIDDENITYNLGFAWELKDIQVDMTTTNDYIEINGTSYYLNQTLNNTYTNLSDPCYYIKENKTSNTYESLYLRWDENLNYKVKVKSKAGQYNAPVTLGIKIGTLNVGQEKYTSLFWHDASEITYYYDDYNKGETWTTNPSYMTDGSISNYASTSTLKDVELCNNNTCSGTDLGSISKVEIRVYGYYLLGQRDIYLRPVFNGTTDGNNNTFVTLSSPSWSRWFDITDDVNRETYPSAWTWNEIRNMDCDVELENDFCSGTNYCSKIEIRVTYNNLPGISDPYPEDDATGISITPTLNITVSDPDGDLLNISWLSNSSGSWQEFGTNSSVGNGTYHQTFSNASVNGQWWYWKVNVSDNEGYNVSSIFKFYTGNQSKIVNSGNTDIKGYLLIQVHYYNSTLDDWLVANDTINETSLRTIEYANEGSYNNNILGLDTIFNGLVNTSNLIDSFGTGTYRVYAAFRNPNGDVLVCDDESLLETTYNFTINIE